jgi:hypothetical protein
MPCCVVLWRSLGTPHDLHLTAITSAAAPLVSLCAHLLVPFHRTISFMRGTGGTFRQQMEMVSSHGIFVAPHGAGLMNILYMPTQSAVIEMFPYHLDHTLYSTMAALMGIANYPIHAIDGHIIWANDTVRLHCMFLLMPLQLCAKNVALVQYSRPCARACVRAALHGSVQ